MTNRPDRRITPRREFVICHFQEIADFGETLSRDPEDLLHYPVSSILQSSILHPPSSIAEGLVDFGRLPYSHYRDVAPGSCLLVVWSDPGQFSERLYSPG